MSKIFKKSFRIIILILAKQQKKNKIYLNIYIFFVKIEKIQKNEEKGKVYFVLNNRTTQNKRDKIIEYKNNKGKGK